VKEENKEIAANGFSIDHDEKPQSSQMNLSF